MGLLSKAVGRMTALNPSSGGNGKDSGGAGERRRPGLLRRAGTLRKAQELSAGPPPDRTRETELVPKKKQDLSSLESELLALPDGLDYPGRLFDLVKERLSLRKGGFFQPAAETEGFAPISTAGWDVTTRHRIRLPFALLDAFCPETAAPCAVVLREAADLDRFRAFFSEREFDLLEELVLVPIYREAPLTERVACLVVSESDAELGDEDWEAARVALQRACRFGAATISPSVVEPAFSFDEEETASYLDGMIGRARTQGKELAVFLLSFDEIVKTVVRDLPDLDEYRVRMSTLGVFQNLVKSMGEVRDTGENRVLLTLIVPEGFDAELILFQMRASLANLFRGSSGLPAFRKRIARFPANGLSGRNLTQILFDACGL